MCERFVTATNSTDPVPISLTARMIKYVILKRRVKFIYERDLNAAGNVSFFLKSSLYFYILKYLASERSKRDTLRGNTIENRGYLFVYIYVCGRTYVILYFDPGMFVFALWSTPSHTSTKQNLSV